MQPNPVCVKTSPQVASFEITALEHSP